MTYPTKRPALTLDFQKSKKLDPRITFSRSSSATYVDPATGLVKTAPDGVARFEKEGLLIEEARTNYIDGNSTIIGWTANNPANTAVTPSTTVCPDGSVTGIRVTGVIANDGARKYFTAIAATYIGSCYARSRNGSSQDVKIAFSGLVGITQTLPASGEWVRIQGNPGVTLGAGNKYFSIRAVSDGALDIDVWGEQAEVGTFPTSLIPTAGSTVTRAADVASMTASPYLYGTFYAKYKHFPGNSSARQIFAVGNSNAYNAFVCRTTATGQADIVLPGVAGLTTTANSDTSDFNTVATARVIGDYAICLNGGTVATTTSSNDQTNNSVITFMYGSVGAVSGGHISRLTFYPERVSDESLEALTA